MSLRTILPQDWYLEMVQEGDLIGAYVVMHDCDSRGACGTALHESQTHEGKITVKCDNPECGETGVVQQ